MKLVYWIAECKQDSNCYSLRAKTRKAVAQMVADSYSATGFEKPRKVVVDYKDAFDLLDQCCSGEDRIANNH